MTDCSRGSNPPEFLGKSGGALAGDWMLQQGGDVQKRPKGGGGLCSVCVCVWKQKMFPACITECGRVLLRVAIRFAFFFLCFVLLVERRVQTHLCRFFVFCVLVEILEEPDLCPVQN